jgi:hypothetical protein
MWYACVTCLKKHRERHFGSKIYNTYYRSIQYKVVGPSSQHNSEMLYICKLLLVGSPYINYENEL